MLQNNSSKVLSKDIRDIKHEQMKVKANEFVDKFRSLDEISDKSSSAKSRLMELRYSSKDNKSNIFQNSLSEFENMMKDRDFSTKVKGTSGKEFYIFSPVKIKKVIDNIIITDFIPLNQLKDSINGIPMKKIADLQEYLKINVTGFIDEICFNNLLDIYTKSLFAGNIQKVELLDKLIANLAFIIGTDIKLGNYIKALIVIKTILLAGEENRFGSFDKLNQVIEENLNEIMKTKFKLRLNFLKKRYTVFLKQDINNGEKLNSFIQEEKSNMSVYDKLNFFNEIINHKSLDFIQIDYIFEFLNSIIGHTLNKSQKENLLTIMDLLIKRTKSKLQEEEYKSIYNRLKSNYFNTLTK
ncbi:MAG: hypothetical protein U0354_00395 [Candidatus Sericytochromatia bacterium]